MLARTRAIIMLALARVRPSRTRVMTMPRTLHRTFTLARVRPSRTRVVTLPRTLESDDESD
jgi:hypothetical protein